MYGWIWRRLPFGTAGKIISSALLTGAVVVLLWFVVFPVIDQHLPNTAAQVVGG